MEIITVTESVVLNSEYHDKEADAKSLCQVICRILNKNRNMKLKKNLSKEQRKTLKENRKTIATPKFTYSIKTRNLLFY